MRKIVKVIEMRWGTMITYQRDNHLLLAYQAPNGYAHYELLATKPYEPYKTILTMHIEEFIGRKAR